MGEGFTVEGFSWRRDVAMIPSLRVG